MKTPDEQVAESIIAEFKKQGLLSDAGLEKIKAKLSSGSLSSGAWKLAFETDRPKKEDQNAS
jgi:hypothetical protein